MSDGLPRAHQLELQQNCVLHAPWYRRTLMSFLSSDTHVMMPKSTQILLPPGCEI